MAEDRAVTEVHTHDTRETLDLLFGGSTETRTKHTYPDGVVVEVLNLGDDVRATAQRAFNGSRVFYRLHEDSGERQILCRFPGYLIDKHVVRASDEMTAAIDDVLEAYVKDVPNEELGATCLTNDGPLILVFKVAGMIRLHMMRSANHGFDEQFAEDFAGQYAGAVFDDLFSTSMETSPWCHLFRQGTRTSAMNPPRDMEDRTFLYMGGVECNMVLAPADLTTEKPAALALAVSILSPENAAEVLCNPNFGLVSYRHPRGEVQILSETYLRRVATLTGVTSDELISGSSGEEGRGFRRRPLALENRISAKLLSSRFPRVLDLLALYVLCGTDSERRTATVSGFSARVDSASGRILANPRRGFFNFCMAAGVNPRREIPFPATPSSMRLAIRRIILDATLPSRAAKVEEQLDEFETALSQSVPRLVARMLREGPRCADLSAAFKTAFGVSVSEIVLSVTGQSTLKMVRSALLLSDPYSMVTMTRFAVRHLIKAEFTPETMRKADLINLLLEYSNSSRRRRMIAQRVADSNVVPPTPEEDESEWPLPAATE